MRDRIITIVLLAFIAACALITFVKIQSHYSAPDYQAPSVWTPSPLMPTTSPASTSSPAPTTPASPASRPRPTHTITVWTTVTGHPAASAAGEDGR
jgi:hypothetical protein